MPNLRPLRLSLRRLPIALAIGLSVLTIGCQSDDPTLDDPIATPDRPVPAAPAAPDGPEDPEDLDRARDEADPDSDAADDPDAEGDDAEDDEFADGNYGEVDEDNTYRPRNLEFEVTLPDGYEIQPQRDGVAFISSDGGFGGEVVFFDEADPLDADDLEDRLKDIYDELLDGASWQLSEIQPDGSVRLDWRGTTPEGRELDAVSYIEQRDEVVFILNVYGIDRPYDAFLDDSQTIVGSYLTWPEADGDFEDVDEELDEDF